MYDAVKRIADRIALRLAKAEASRTGLSQPDAEKLILDAIRFSVVNRNLEGEALKEAFESELNSSSEEYAANYRKIQSEAKIKMIRPAYDKAVRAGTDPVEFIRVMLGLPKELVEETIAELKRQDEEVAEIRAGQSPEGESIPTPRAEAEDAADDDDWDNVPSSPGPAPDLFAGAVRNDDQ